MISQVHTESELEFWGNFFVANQCRKRMKITFENFMRLSKQKKQQYIKHYLNPIYQNPRRTPCKK